MNLQTIENEHSDIGNGLNEHGFANKSYWEKIKNLKHAQAVSQ